MKNLNYIQVPATNAEDENQSLTKWHDNKCISINEGTHVTLFVDHQDEIIIEGEIDKTITRAFPIRIAKPLTRAKIINAAEMAAYNLNNAEDVASFNASLARKARVNEDIAEVTEHDDFIAWVKNKIEIFGY